MKNKCRQQNIYLLKIWAHVSLYRDVRNECIVKCLNLAKICSFKIIRVLLKKIRLHPSHPCSIISPA